MRFALSLAALLLATLAAEPLYAQTPSNSGSVYSRFGVGERVGFGSSQSQQMGVAGTAIRSTTYTGLNNPALWSDQQLVQLVFAAQVQGIRAEDASGATSGLASGDVSAFQFSVPVYENRLGVTLAYRPYSRVNYLVRTEDILNEPSLPQDTIGYRVNLEGDGGLHQIDLGFGYRVSRHLSVGASGFARFGLLEDRQRTEFAPATGLGESRTTRRTRAYGFGATLGAVASTTGLLGEQDALSVGASLTLPTRMELDRVRTLGFSLDEDTLRVPSSGSATLPLVLNAGVSYVPNARWLLAADVLYEPWSGFESDLSFGGYSATTGESVLRDRLRVGGGVQATPAGTNRSAPYLARASYRFGGYMEQSYVAPLDQDVTTLALTGGVSLPGVFPGARFDLGLEGGTRGTTESGLVRDLFIKGTVTLNFGERWFVRRRFG